MAAPALRRASLVLAALAGAGAGGVGGCAAPAPDHDGAEPVAMPEAFAVAGEAPLEELWWTAFGDAELDALVDHALQANFELASSWERLREARALSEREAALLWPELEGFAEASTRRPAAGGDGEALELGLRASYELDLWGRLGAAADAEELRAEATLADYRTAALTLSAEVARTWFRLLEARAQRALLDEQVAANEQVLQLIRARVGTGQVRGVDILRQRQLIEATRARRIVAAARVEVLEHLLQVLLGRAPQHAFADPAAALPDVDALPPPPATGLPAELVRRRPDVQRAQLLLRAADQEVAAAVAERYPRISISASLSTREQGADELFEDWLRSLAANLVAPLVDGGRRVAEVERRRAIADGLLYDYGQATLVAFQEVEDALVLERQERERIVTLRLRVELGERSYEQLRAEYFNGLADYIDVLTALISVQEARRELLSARLLLVEARIGLYRALAGGFETARETSP